jgi:two-component system NarL family sensor kinase
MGQRINNTADRASSWLCLLICILLYTVAAKAQDLPVVSHEWYPQFPSREKLDSIQIKKLFEKATVVADKDLDSAISLFSLALQHSRSIYYWHGMVSNITAIGYCYEKKGDFEKALSIHRSAFLYCNISKNPRLFLKHYQSMGDFYRNRGIHDTAIFYYHQVLEQIKQHPAADTADVYLLSIYQKLGILYINHAQNEFGTAFYYLDKAEQLAMKKKDDRTLADIYIAKGAAYANLASRGDHDYSRGMYYTEKGLGLLKKNDSAGSFGTAYCNLGIMHINQGMTAKGVTYIERAFDDSAYLKKETQSGIRPYLAIGAAYIKLKDYNKAEFYLNKAGDASEKNRSRTDLLEVYSILSNLYLLKEDYKMAFAAQQSYSLLRDSVLNEEKIKANASLEVKYRSVEKDKEIVTGKLKLNEQRSKIREQRLWIAAGAGGTLLLGILLMVLYRNNRQRRRLQEEKINSMAQQQEITNLKAMVQGEEKERGRLARELHDGIVGQLAAVKLNLSDVQQRYSVLRDAKDFREAIHQLDDAALDLRNTAHNLMPELLLQQGIVASLAQYCEKMSKHAGFRIYFHLTGVLPQMDPDAGLSLYRIIQELIQNIIKHAKASEAVVQINCHDDLVLVTVEDNGVGMGTNNQQQEKILKTVRTRVHILKGQMNISSKTGQGTTVTIEFDPAQLKVVQQAAQDRENTADSFTASTNALFPDETR